MDDQTTKLLMKKVKKHKKWTEGAFVNPVYWEVNGKPYYMGGFTKNNEVVGTAYVSTGDEVREEAMEAQSNLSLFADLSSSILNAGGERLNIPTEYYTNPLNIPVSTTDAKVLEGRKAFAVLWELQQKFNEDTRGYKNYYDEALKIGRITEEDVLRTQQTANQMSMYQYTTLHTLVQKNEEIRSFAAYLEKQDGWDRLMKEEQKFVKGIAENKDMLQKNLRNLDMAEHADYETMTALNFERMVEKNKKSIDSQKQFVRYPL
ncbi:hypothetical protein [Planococcus ruber]|uniref:hypothetical protein n=1 Tax=Planococcus ruber TaxID=2027871 RepID=UPI001FF03FFF|nr:hypothetical protein [Planococcus ruber]MCJ1908056.1 hypothetical protein [Planococcus ruber]